MAGIAIRKTNRFSASLILLAYGWYCNQKNKKPDISPTIDCINIILAALDIINKPLLKYNIN